MPALGIDCAWTRPAPTAVRQAGYTFVIGYLSTDPTKNLNSANIDAYHAQDLDILLIWETTANRALAGMAAGIDDARQAVAQATALGYPSSCPIFFACDTNANPLQVRPYFRGVSTIYPNAGTYGSLAVVDDMLDAGIVRYGWQTCAWSGSTVSTKAHLYQRLKPTLQLSGSFDEDVLLRPIPMWTPTPTAPTPAQTPPVIPYHGKAHPDMAHTLIVRRSTGEIYTVTEMLDERKHIIDPATIASIEADPDYETKQLPDDEIDAIPLVGA